jgi:hypothetical protein
MASRIGVSAQAAWAPGSPVYDGLHKRYGSIVEVETPRGSSKANAVKLAGHGLTWWTNARDVVTLEGERPNPVEALREIREQVSGLLNSNGWREALAERDPNGVTVWVGPRLFKIDDLAAEALGEARRGMKGNPDLAIVSLGMNPPRHGKPQTFADTKDVGTAYRGYSVRGTQLHGVHVSKDGYHIATVVDEAHAKAVIDMLHGDATPNVAGNPSGEVFGSDVLAIVYQHNEDPSGDVRVHTFGGKKEAKWRETARGVEVYDLPRTTGVYMSAEGESRVVMQHRRGLPLVQEF